MTTTTFIDHFQILSKIGTGTTSIVYKAQNTVTLQLNALKIFKNSFRSFFQTEITILNRLPPHPNLVQAFHYNREGLLTTPHVTKRVSFIAFELCQKGELYDILVKGKFPQEVSKYYFLQILEGVRAIHQQGWAHLDLKPENILLTQDYQLKVSDLGFALPLEGINHGKIGTQAYMAPQILQMRPFQSQKATVFSLGVLLFIIVVGHPPFSKASPQDSCFKLIYQGNWDLFWMRHRAETLSFKAKELIQKLLEPVSNERICMSQVINHAWLREQNFSEEDCIEYMEERAQ